MRTLNWKGPYRYVFLAKPGDKWPTLNGDLDPIPPIAGYIIGSTLQTDMINKHITSISKAIDLDLDDYHKRAEPWAAIGVQVSLANSFDYTIPVPFDYAWQYIDQVTRTPKINQVVIYPPHRLWTTVPSLDYMIEYVGESTLGVTDDDTAKTGTKATVDA